MELTMRNIKEQLHQPTLTILPIACGAISPPQQPKGRQDCQTGFIARSNWYGEYTAQNQYVDYYNRTTAAKAGFMYHEIGDAF